jgi:hypothetical protein
VYDTWNRLIDPSNSISVIMDLEEKCVAPPANIRNKEAAQKKGLPVEIIYTAT